MYDILTAPRCECGKHKEPHLTMTNTGDDQRTWAVIWYCLHDTQS